MDDKWIVLAEKGPPEESDAVIMWAVSASEGVFLAEYWDIREESWENILLWSGTPMPVCDVTHYQELAWPEPPKEE